MLMHRFAGRIAAWDDGWWCVLDGGQRHGGDVRVRRTLLRMRADGGLDLYGGGMRRLKES